MLSEPMPRNAKVVGSGTAVASETSSQLIPASGTVVLSLKAASDEVENEK